MDLPIRHQCTVSGPLGFVLRLSQIAGVAALKFESLPKGWRIRTSRAADVYGRTAIYLMCLLTAVTLTWDYRLDRVLSFHFRSGSYGMLSIADASVVSAVLLAAARSGMQRMQHLITCLAKINKINAELNHYGPHKSFKQNEILTTVWSLFSNMIMFVDCGILFYEIYMRQGNFCMEGMYIGYYVEAAIMKVLTLQLTLLLTAVLSSFHHLNDCLLNLLRQIRLGAIYNSPEIMVSAMVHRLGYLYYCLCDIVHQIDVDHGAVLVLLIASLFLHLIMTPYNFITRIFGNEWDYYKAVIQFFAAAYHAVDLVMIVEPCHQTHRQMNRTKHLISQLMLAAPPDHYALHLELELFYEHLLLNNVFYFPLRMFKLHRNLIVTILGSITTYLVVVIQL